MKRTDLTEQAG